VCETASRGIHHRTLQHLLVQVSVDREHRWPRGSDLTVGSGTSDQIQTNLFGCSEEGFVCEHSFSGEVSRAALKRCPIYVLGKY
jgi:hypothetical protein